MFSAKTRISAHSNALLTSPEKISNVTYHLFENGTHFLLKMATLEEEKARQTAIQFCVQTVMTSSDSFRHLKSTDIYIGISRSFVFKWHGRFRDGWTETETMHECP